jgi:hypothetical protein
MMRSIFIFILSHGTLVGHSVSFFCFFRYSLSKSILPTLQNPTQVSFGWNHTCALDHTGVVCWGRNSEGQIDVPTLSNPTQISLRGSVSCALDDSGVVCWGRNEYGQTDVPSLSNPTQVSLGLNHSCALDDAGVVCWGFNNNGETDVPELSFTFDEDDADADVTSAVLDIDGNGSVDALTDGLMVLRYLFGLRGQGLINGAIADNAMRTEAADVEAYIQSLMPSF